jgi:hypothetical protein
VDGGAVAVLVCDDGGDEVVSVPAHTVRVAAGLRAFFLLIRDRGSLLLRV